MNQTTSLLPVWATGYRDIRVSRETITTHEKCQFCGARSNGHKVAYTGITGGRFDSFACVTHANELLDSGLPYYVTGTKV